MKKPGSHAANLKLLDKTLGPTTYQRALAYIHGIEIPRYKVLNDVQYDVGIGLGPVDPKVIAARRVK